MEHRDMLARLAAARRSPGSERRVLRLGLHALRVQGLDAELARALDRRWGAFLQPDGAEWPGYTVRLLRAGPGRWLAGPAPGGLYPLEALGRSERRLLVSEHFALGRERRGGTWRVGLSEGCAEPLERVLDNVCRILAARLALAYGGFALHAGGVLRGGRAYLFAGKSRSGKSTAVRLAAPARSLGDDFALVLRGRSTWLVPALPFDNAERVVDEPPTGLHELAGIWQLAQARRTHVERLPEALGVAALMSCAAFPWLFPEAAAALLDRVRELVVGGRFARLHFTREASLWAHLEVP